MSQNKTMTEKQIEKFNFVKDNLKVLIDISSSFDEANNYVEELCEIETDNYQAKLEVLKSCYEEVLEIEFDVTKDNLQAIYNSTMNTLLKK